jgi:integrase
MKTRYRLIRRGNRGGAFYCVDSQSGQRTSLGTSDESVALRIVQAKNDTERQPFLNLQIAKAYLAGADSNYVKRTWGEVMSEFIKNKTGPNRRRYDCAVRDNAYDSIRNLTLLETQPEHFFHVLQVGCVSTNNHLRRFHNFALDVGWLLRPVLPKRQWPAIRYKIKRAITRAEHDLIVSRENNAELRAFLWCCWHLGGSQTDLANLKADDIDWDNQVVSFFRRKTGTPQVVKFGAGLAEILRSLPEVGLLFPTLASMDEKHRASRFQRSCRRVKITGVSLHSYRYAWAERAKKAGYPERFAQEALGHNSLAVHRAYARKARFELPPLEEYENAQAGRKVLALDPKQSMASADVEKPPDKVTG